MVQPSSPPKNVLGFGGQQDDLEKVVYVRWNEERVSCSNGIDEGLLSILFELKREGKRVRRARIIFSKKKRKREMRPAGDRKKRKRSFRAIRSREF